MPPPYCQRQLFNGSKGIDPEYNMWKTAGDQLIDPVTGNFKDGIARRYTPEKWEDYLFRTGQKVQGDEYQVVQIKLPISTH